MTPEITIVMATYKQGRFIREAFDSIDGQKVEKILKVVGVTGDRKSGIEQLPIPPSNFQTLPADKMPNFWESRQAGLSCTETPYVTFFDSDDVMLPGCLEKGFTVAKEIASRGKIPIVAMSFRMVDEELRPMQDVVLPEFSMDKMMSGSIIPDFSITTTDVLRSIGGYFDPDGYDCGHPYYPYALWLRVLKKYGDKVEVKLLPEIGWLYRQHRHGMHNRFQSKRRSAENVRKAREVARHYFPEGD